MTVEQWNRRARWCLVALDNTDIRDRARACLRHWESIERTVPSRELQAAAHQGLIVGAVKTAVEQHRRGLLLLHGPKGTGKTVGAAWRAYRCEGEVLWLSAVEVALARDPAQIQRWIDAIGSAALVVLDDIGAAGTVGKYESPRLAALMTAMTNRRRPSIITTNLSRRDLERAYDHGGGRLIDRLTMEPNRMVEVPAEASRRARAEEPPETLPRREQRARAFLQACQACYEASQAVTVQEVDQVAVLLVASRLGVGDLGALDEAVEQRARQLARVGRLVEGLASGMVVTGEPC